MSLTEADLDAIGARMGSVPPEIHAEHHSFLGQWIEREKIKQRREEARQLRMDRLKSQVVAGVLISMASSLGAALLWVGNYAREHWR